MVETTGHQAIDPQVQIETADPGKKDVGMDVAMDAVTGVREQDRHPSDENPLQIQGQAR